MKPEWLEDHYYHRQEGQRQISVIPLALGRARILIGPLSYDPYSTWSEAY